MNVNIFIVLFFTLFTGGHSLECYGCSSTSSCVGIQKTCPAELTTCASATLTLINGTSTITTKLKSCYLPQGCGNGSVNFGASRTVVSVQCCNTDLCNSEAIPDFNFNSPNGKQCYSCDGKNCSNKLNCLGTEDHCFTGQANILSLPPMLKGCVSKSICDEATVAEGLESVSCCQGNLCNSAKSITQSFVLFSLPFLIYLLFH